MFQFHPYSVLALVATVTCWALAVVLYRVGARGSVARKLAVLLGIEGTTLISAGYIDLMLTPVVRAHPLYQRWFDAEFVVHTLGDCSMLALYPPFLAATLGTRPTRPFANRRIRIGLAIAATLLFAATLTTPMTFGASLLYVALALVFWFAFAASIQAWYRATGPPNMILAFLNCTPCEKRLSLAVGLSASLASMPGVNSPLVSASTSSWIPGLSRSWMHMP